MYVKPDLVGIVVSLFDQFDFLNILNVSFMFSSQSILFGRFSKFLRTLYFSFLSTTRI